MTFSVINYIIPQPIAGRLGPAKVLRIQINYSNPPPPPPVRTTIISLPLLESCRLKSPKEW